MDLIVDIRPDPRLSTESPGWFIGERWLDDKTALTDADVDWLEGHWELASGSASND